MVQARRLLQPKNISHVFLAQRDLCHFHGHSVVAPQFQLTENAEGILNNYNAQDDRMRSSVLLSSGVNPPIFRVKKRTNHILLIADRRRSRWIAHPPNCLYSLTEAST